MRASVTRIHSVFSVLGDILAFVLGLPEVLGNAARWGYLTLVPAPFIIAETAWFFTVPETPMFQIQCGESRDKVDHSLHYYLGPSADKFRSSVDENLKKEKESKSRGNKAGWWHSIKECFKNPTQRKLFFLWMILGLTGPFSGGSITMHYLTSMIAQGGSAFSSFDKFAALAIYCVRVPVVIGSLYTINKFGRKPLLIWSIWIITGSLAVLTAISFAQQYFAASISVYSLTWVRIVFIFLLAAISYIINSVAALIVSETAKQMARALSLGVYKFLFHIGGLCLIFAWPPVSKLCEGGAYLMLAIPFLAICIYLTIMCPETKNIDFIGEDEKTDGQSRKSEEKDEHDA